MGTTGVITANTEARLLNEGERQAVQEQLERMLAHPLFKHSKRYPAFLRYVVEHTLDGHTDQVKERVLGVEVFGRDVHYDTNQDPVVRMTAGEIRKRIAQYYHEPGRDGEMRIELPCGTYVPEFHPPHTVPVVEAPQVIMVAEPPPVAQPVRPRPNAAKAAAALIFVSAIAIMAWVKPWASRPAIDRFWAPVLDSSSRVLICVGQPHFKTFPGMSSNLQTITSGIPETGVPDAEVSLHDLYLMGRHYISLWDSITATRLAAAMESRSKPYHVRGELSTSLSDLRDGPAVLVGAFNNEWTLRLTGPLRFSFVNPQKGIFGIKDNQNPSADTWKVDTSLPYTKVTNDYAVISRVKDPITDRVLVVAGGVGYWGTIAAGEFLTDPKYMEQVGKTASAGWDRKNIQIVIGTKVIAGNSGPPEVLATYFW